MPVKCVCLAHEPFGVKTKFKAEVVAICLAYIIICVALKFMGCGGSYGGLKMTKSPILVLQCVQRKFLILGVARKFTVG